MNAILITGGVGFIGSNFLEYFLSKYPQHQVINVDKLTYAADLSNLRGVERNPHYTFIKGDISDAQLIHSLFEKYNIKGVIHFAAESHVDNSIKNPEAFIKSNVYGTFILLEAARKYWFESPFKPKAGYEGCRFHHISTDEVYGTLGEVGYFTEKTAYAPNSPYSASKASSDMIARSYHHTYGLNLLISNCSNNYGKNQHDEKLIPTVIRNAMQKQAIPIYGNGLNIRDWLYVEDHCKAIDTIYHNGKIGETYNVGGNSEKTNLEIVNNICSILDETLPISNFSYKQLISFVSDRPGHDFRYAIDSQKIKQDLGWMPKETFNSGLEKTVNWYVKKYSEKV